MISASNLIDFNSQIRISVDLLLNVIGFEARAGAIASCPAIEWERAFSLAFQSDKLFSYFDNLKYMRSRGAVIIEDYLSFLRFELSSKIQSLGAEKNSAGLNIAVDISSMNRAMISSVLIALCQAADAINTLTFCYMPARFSTPDRIFPTIDSIGAVIPELAGTQAQPNLPVCMVMGVGYEYGLAVGLISRIEPSAAICFQAIGHDVQYDRAVKEANFDFDFGLPDVRIVKYNVLDAKSSYRFIESIVLGATRNSRVVFVPMGPKLFALICNLIALSQFGQIAIWRVVSGSTLVRNSFPDDRFVMAEISMEEFRSLRSSVKFISG